VHERQRNPPLRVALRRAERRTDACADDIERAIVAGALTELPVHRFSLDDIAAAHEAVEAGVVGKVLVDIE